jgi:hypothetical protein
VKPSPLLRSFRKQLEDRALEYFLVTEDRQSEGSPLVAGSMLRLAAKAYGRQLLAERDLGRRGDRCHFSDERSRISAARLSKLIAE